MTSEYNLLVGEAWLRRDVWRRALIKERSGSAVWRKVWIIKNYLLNSRSKGSLMGGGVTYGGRCSQWKTLWTFHIHPCCCRCCCSRSRERRWFWGSAGSWESSRYLQEEDGRMFNSCVHLSLKKTHPQPKIFCKLSLLRNLNMLRLVRNRGYSVPLRSWKRHNHTVKSLLYLFPFSLFSHVRE